MAGRLASSPPPWKQGEDAALALRHRLRLGDGPISVWEVIRRIDGLALALHDFGEDEGDGVYILKGARSLIVVNTARRPARQRFTAAHELGHHELHRHERRNLMIEDHDIFVETGNDPAEQAANAFAANLLAPSSALRDATASKKRKVTPEDVVALIAEFGLSYEATCYRLRNARLITSPALDGLLEAGRGGVDFLLADAGIDEGKLFPAGQALPREYLDHAAGLWQRRFISDERFAAMVRMSPKAAGEWLAHRAVTRPELPDYDREAADKLLEELQ